jgi:hypothetical protein
MGRFKSKLLLSLVSVVVGGAVLSLKPLTPSGDTSDKFFTVRSTNGHVLELDNGQLVALAGSYIPRQAETNHRPELEENLRERILNKKVRIKTVLKSRGDKSTYPLLDVVIAYVVEEGKEVNLNKVLLKEGMAFFSWQFFSGYKQYWKLEQEAKKEGRGIWKENPTVLYVTKSGWQDLHYPQCPKVLNLKESERVEYYVEWPAMYGARGMGYYGCPYCAEIEQKGKGRKKQGAWY